MDDLNEKIKRGQDLYREDGHTDDVKSELDARIDAMFDHAKGPGKKKPNGTTWLVLVLLLLMVLAGLYFMKNSADHQEVSTSEIFAANYEPFPNTINGQTRGEAGTIIEGEVDFQQAMLLYGQGNYQEALVYMEGITTDATKLLYRGIALLETNQNEAAIQSLEQSVALEDDEIQDAATWYLALAQVKAGNVSSAQVALEAILQMDEHYKKKEAADILEKLK